MKCRSSALEGWETKMGLSLCGWELWNNRKRQTKAETKFNQILSFSVSREEEKVQILYGNVMSVFHYTFHIFLTFYGLHLWLWKGYENNNLLKALQYSNLALHSYDFTGQRFRCVMLVVANVASSGLQRSPEVPQIPRFFFHCQI